jgi:hypothetical protein
MDIKELKLLVSNAIKGFNSKSYTRVLTLSYPSLAEELKNVTAQFNPKNLNESIFILLKEEPKNCSRGNKPIFASYELGYKTSCGKSGVCACSKEQQQKKIAEWHQSLDSAQKEKMIQKSKDTMFANHGVYNSMQSAKSVEKLKKTNLEKYGAEFPFGSDAIKTKIKKTNLEKYGVEKPFQNADIRNKGNKTTIEKYGSLMTHARKAAYEKYNGENPWYDTDVQEKRKHTMIEKYDTPHALKNKQIFDKMQIDNIAKFGRPNPAQLSYSDTTWEIVKDPAKFLETVKDKNSVQIANELGTDSGTILRYARKYNVLDKMVFQPLSAMEDDLKGWLDEQGIKYKQHDRTILSGRKEVDFYFPDNNFGIELNGLYQHSELSCGKDNLYHIQKYKGCEMKHIQLLQYWQDEYWAHRKNIHSKILYLSNKITNKIHARKLELKIIENTSLERDFYESNHIQGFAEYRQHSAGAFYNDQLVGIISFAQNNGRMELIRYATDLGIVCNGLFSRLLKFSINSFKLSGRIVSLSDNRHGNGNLYYQSGWKYESELPPDYMYTDDYQTRQHKQHFRKANLIKRFSLDPTWVANHTEWEIVQEFGFDRLWDAGKKRWSLTI